MIEEKVRSNLLQLLKFKTANSVKLTLMVFALCIVHYSLLAQSKDSAGLATDLRLKGDSLFKIAEYDEAQEFLNKSLTIFELLKLDSSSARVSNVLGLTYWYSDINDSALYHYRRGLVYAERSKSAKEIARLNISIGNFYRFENENDRAISFFLKALKVINEDDKDLIELEASVLTGIGNLHLNRFDSDYLNLDSAFKYYLKAERLVVGNPAFLRTYSDILSNLGVVMEEKGLLDSAYDWYNQSLAITLEQHNREGEVISYFNIGNVRKEQGKYKEALTWYFKCFSLSNELDKPILAKNTAWNIGLTYTWLAEAKNATRYFDVYDSISSAIYSRERAESIADFETRFNVLDIEARNAAQALEIAQNKRRNQLYVVVIISIIVVSLFWALVNELRKKNLKSLAEKNQQLANQKINDLLQQQEINSLQGVLTGQEEERQRIATDLHDKLGAILGMVKLHFSAVEERIDVLRDDNKKQYDKANELLDQASTEVRNISHNLLSGVLVKFGLVPALQDLRDTVEATGKLKLQLIAGAEMENRLSGEQELQIYRIVQELVSNILKHSRATEAIIQLNRSNGEINLMVEDNGVGFDVESARKKEGIGLKNLEARAAKLNAKLHFDSGKGAGTTVSIDIPLADYLY